MSTPQTSSVPRGVFAAVATPVDEKFEPIKAAFIKHCRWLLANGCDGLAPLGTTGEANSLSLTQRLGLIDAMVEAGLPMGACIIGGGSCALADAVELSRKIDKVGGGGALLLPAFYYKNPSEDGLFAFFSEIIQRVGSKNFRLYLYHIPAMSSVPITSGLIARLMKEYGAGTMAGLKDSAGDWNYSAGLLKEFPGFGLLSGTEEFLLANLRAGGAGCISATTNFTAPLAHAVYAGWRSADADTLQAKLSEVRLLTQKFPLQAAVKAVVALISGDAKWRAMLPPVSSLSTAQAADLAAKLEALPQMRGILPAHQHA